MHAFVRINGQIDNIGDLVIRRRLLAFATKFGKLHLHVGEADDTFLEQLVPEGTEVFRSIGEFRKAALQTAVKDRVVYFDEPGEFYIHQPLTSLIKNHLRLGVFLRQLRKRHGKSFLLGVGIRHRLTFLQRMIVRLGVNGFDLIRWRDPRSASQVGPRTTMPDWAFGEPSLGVETERNLLVVSLRCDRPAPSSAWLAGVRQHADTQGLSIVVVTQVGRDEHRSKELAKALGGVVANWSISEMDIVESELRQTYSKARVVISDRLHVLIIAAMEGSIPLCLTEFAEEKIERHFNTIGLASISDNVSGWPISNISQRIFDQQVRSNGLRLQVSKASAKIAEVEQEVTRIVETR